MFNMRWLLLLCVLLAVNNIVNSRPNKEKDPDYDEDVLNDEFGDGYANLGDEDDDNDDDEQDEELTDPPVIKTLPQIMRATEGSIVNLPCETENAEPFSVMWKQNGVMIYQDKIQVGQRNARFQRFNNQTLQIKQVQASDQGDYECSISTSPDLTAVKHHLIVLTPPRIVAATANNNTNTMVERGSTLNLICIAEGNPVPKVSWSKNGHRVSGENAGNGRSTIFIENVGREDHGLYVCMADNGNRKEPTIQSVNVEVIHKPDMKIERVIAGETEMHLICKVHANPNANVTWTRNNQPIRENKNIVVEHAKHNHELIVKILKVDDSYFGNYSCHAKNNLGMIEKQIVVSGVPVTPKFENHRFIGENNELKTKWIIMSMTPIKTVQLQYRKKGESIKTWQTENKEINQAAGYQHEVEHILKNLGEGVYEARLRAENQFGWSDFSRAISLEGKPHANSISKKEDAPDDITEEPESSSTGSGTRTIMSTTVLFVIMLNMFRSFV